MVGVALRLLVVGGLAAAAFAVVAKALVEAAVK